MSGHQNNVNSIRKLFFYKKRTVIASSSDDGTIFLWNYNKSTNLFQKYKEIKLGKNRIQSLEESIKYEQLISGLCRFGIIFYNLNNQQIQKINMNVNNCIRAIKIIDEGDILIVAGNQEINLINIDTKLNVFCMRFSLKCEFNCIFQKKNNNILITEYGDICKINEFKFDKKNQSLNLLSTREKDFNSYITIINELDNGDLIIGGYDKKLILYSNHS